MIKNKIIILLIASTILLFVNYLIDIDFFKKIKKHLIDLPPDYHDFLISLEMEFIKDSKDIQLGKMKDIELSYNLNLEKYNLVEGFYSGISNAFPGSGYIDFHKDRLLVLSSRGFLGYAKNINEDLTLTKIENNINDFIGVQQFYKSHMFSIKDIYVSKDQIFVSYNEEIKPDCWNTSVIYGDINYNKIYFKKFFSPKECIHSLNNVDHEFNPHQSGGRMFSFDDNHILLTIGDYRERFYAQKKNSVNGKIIKINIYDNSHEIISMGHRNPQGLYLDKENNFILATEHGPQGGDEINLIDIDKIDQNKILNYGWPIVSAGEHYGGKVEKNKNKYKKYPLHKSHAKYGFIEPLYSFVPSIAISEITKISDKKYIVSSMKDKSLYFFELNNKQKIINLKRVDIFERIRDIIFKNNKLYLFLEDTASIGVIEFK